MRVDHFCVGYIDIKIRGWNEYTAFMSLANHEQYIAQWCAICRWCNLESVRWLWLSLITRGKDMDRLKSSFRIILSGILWWSCSLLECLTLSSFSFESICHPSSRRIAGVSCFISEAQPRNDYRQVWICTVSFNAILAQVSLLSIETCRWLLAYGPIKISSGWRSGWVVR